MPRLSGGSSAPSVLEDIGRLTMEAVSREATTAVCQQDAILDEYRAVERKARQDRTRHNRAGQGRAGQGRSLGRFSVLQFGQYAGSDYPTRSFPSRRSTRLPLAAIPPIWSLF